MIRVTIDLISAIHPSRDQTLGVMYVTNDGSGSHARRNYHVQVCRKGSFDIGNAGAIKTTRLGKVLNFPSPSYNVWRLISRAILSAFPEEASAKIHEHPDNPIGPIVITKDVESCPLCGLHQHGLD